MNPIVGPEQYYQTLQRLFADQGLGAEAGSPTCRPPQQMQALLAATDAAGDGTTERGTKTKSRRNAGPGRDPEETDRGGPT
jgi:hypothetical protein